MIGLITVFINLFEGIAKLLIWLFTLNMTQSEISVAGEIFVKIATFAVSYGVVGCIFNAIGVFDSKAMKFLYFVISTMVSFALCYVIMLIETYLLYIAIVLGILLVIIIFGICITAKE